METVRIGFVGTGGMGQMAHLRNYVSLKDCCVVAMAEIRPQTAQAVAAHYGIPKVYADHRQMLAAEKLDAIVASQPFERHSVLLPDLYKAVKHLFTEKPLAISAGAGESLASQAAAAGCIHMVGYHKRSDPATAYAKALIDRWRSGGEMGPLQYVRILMPAGDWIANGMTGRISLSDKAGPLEREPLPADMDEATAREYCAFVNYYIHQVNMMRYLLGEPYELTFADKSGVLLAMQSRSGVPGLIEMSPYRTTIEWEESFLIAFAKGYIKVSLPAPLTCNRPGKVEVYADPGDGATPMRSTPTLPWVDAMAQQAANFVKVCRGEMKPPCDASEAAEDLRIARQYIRLRYGS